MNHTQIRKVERVLDTTLSHITTALMNIQPQGEHHVLRRNYGVENSLPQAAVSFKDNTGVSLLLLLFILLRSPKTQCITMSRFM